MHTFSRTMSPLELDSKCSALVTTSTPNELISVGSGAVCSVMILKKNTLYAISQLLKDLNMNYYTAVSPFWFVAVSVCRRSGLLLIAVSPFWFVVVLTIVCPSVTLVNCIQGPGVWRYRQTYFQYWFVWFCNVLIYCHWHVSGRFWPFVVNKILYYYIKIQGSGKILPFSTAIAVYLGNGTK